MLSCQGGLAFDSGYQLLLFWGDHTLTVDLKIFIFKLFPFLDCGSGFQPRESSGLGHLSRLEAAPTQKEPIYIRKSALITSFHLFIL